MRNLLYGSRPLFTYKDLFVISDVHGELDKLKKLISNLPLTAESILVFVGDLIDNGPDGVGVLIYIRELKKQYQVHIIEGNHEQVFKRILKGTYMMQGALDQGFLDEFLYYGAHAVTVEQINRIVKAYKLDEILDTTIPYLEARDLIITHAPISAREWKNMGFSEWQEEDYENLYFGDIYPLDHLAKSNILWDFIEDESEVVKNLEKFLICGHQNHRCKYSEPRVFPHRAFIDCGAGYSRDKPLFAMNFPSKKIYSSI